MSNPAITNVLSLGAGVQSTAVFLMSCAGELPKLDLAIFADTGWEPAAVYDQLERLEKIGLDNGVPVVRVTAGNIRQDMLEEAVPANRGRFAVIPLHTKNKEGHKAILRRQCTREYKIEPITQYIRQHILKLRKRQRGPRTPAVRQWFGISLDEFQRMRVPDKSWLEFYYPLIENRVTRNGCLEWCKKNGFSEPPRSACIGCPYHSNKEWREMQTTRPAEFKDAVEFDNQVRHMAGMDAEVFVHSNCKPLSDIDLRSDTERGQLTLWNEECSGMCGV